MTILVGVVTGSWLGSEVTSKDGVNKEIAAINCSLPHYPLLCLICQTAGKERAIFIRKCYAHCKGQESTVGVAAQ